MPKQTEADLISLFKDQVSNVTSEIQGYISQTLEADPHYLFRERPRKK